MAPRNAIILIGFVLLPIMCYSQYVPGLKAAPNSHTTQKAKPPIDCNVMSSSILYVDSAAVSGLGTGLSWADAYLELSSALLIAKACPNVDSILVGKGTYYPQDSFGLAPSEPMNVSFTLSDSLVLMGGFDPINGIVSVSQRDWEIHKTILSGDLLQNDSSEYKVLYDLDDNIEREDNARHILDQTDCPISNATLIDGFYFIGGNAEGEEFEEENGGAMLLIDASPIIQNCEFIYNSADDEGGAVFGDTLSSPHFFNVSFLNNFSDDDGGAILNKDSMHFENCVFEHNITDDDGGAISSDSMTYTHIMNSYFLFNDAYEEGGGVFSEYGSSLLVDSSIFSENIAGQVGGGISIYGTNSIIKSSQFDLNFSYLAGGGIHSAQSQLEIENCTFYNNESEYGGGIFSIEENVFEPLKQPNQEITTKSILGGGESYLQVSESDFILNYADYAGGAIANAEGDVIIESCKFRENESEFGAAVSNGVVGPFAPLKNIRRDQVSPKCFDCAIEFNGGQMHVDSSTFVQNAAFVGIGGGLGVYKGELKLTNSKLDSNLAFWGGAIISIDAFLDIDSSQFSMDSAYAGGAIFSINYALDDLNDPLGILPEPIGKAFIRNSAFTSNWSAEVGGAIINVDVDLAIDGSTFKANESEQAGGAIFNEYGALTSKNSLYSGNHSMYGGAILIDAGPSLGPVMSFKSSRKVSSKRFKKPNTVKRLEDSYRNSRLVQPLDPNEFVFINNTFGFNKAVYDGGAMYVDNTENVYVINTIVSGNIDSSGYDSPFSGIFNDNSVISFEHSLIQGSGGSMDWNNDLGTDDGNNLDQDPFYTMEADTTSLPNTTGDLRLLSCSPAINVGKDTIGLGLGQVDLDDNARIFGSSIDLGAFEFQSLPLGDLVVVNTNDDGCGSLRYAIAQAQSGDTITFDSGINGDTINLTSGEIVIDSNLVIMGNDSSNTIVDGSFNSRVFQITIGDTVEMIDLRIQNGYLEGSICPIDCGAGILNSGVLNLDGVAIVNNVVEDTVSGIFGGGEFGGGGLYNYGGEVKIRNSCFLRNEALNINIFHHADGAAIYNFSGEIDLRNSIFSMNDADDDGSAVFNIGTSGQGIVTMDEVEITNNIAGNHGAIFNHLSNTVININNSRISENSGVGAGAIFNNGEVTIKNSELKGNSGTLGGAIFNSSASLEIRNSVLSGNVSTLEGGAVFNQGSLSFTPVVLINSTLSGNKSGTSGGAIYNNDLGDTTTIDLVNTIIAHNIDNGSGPDIYKESGEVIDRGGNFISNTTSVDLDFDTSTLLGNSIIPLDPLFIMNVDTFNLPNVSGDLRLDCHSPAIESGKIDTSGLGLGSSDLDNNLRIFGSTIDIGAYENQDSKCQPLDIVEIKGQGLVCEGSNTITYACEVEYATSYQWSYNGTGTIVGDINDSEVNLDFSGDLLGGDLIIMAFNDVDTVYDTLGIVILDPVLCALTECGVATINITQSLLDFGLPQDIRAQVNINATGIISDGEVYRFFAGDNIVLGPEFEVELGAILEVDIESCIPAQLAQGIIKRYQSADTKAKARLIRQIELISGVRFRN